MTSFDDELRGALAERAAHAGHVADVLPGVRRRARRLRRRRAASVVVGASVAVLLLGALPMVLHPGWHTSEDADGPGAAPPLAPSFITGTAADRVPPPSALTWGARGEPDKAPASLRLVATERLAKLLGVSPKRVTSTVLYASQTAALGHDWVYVAQGWSTAARGKAAQVVAVRSGASGANARAVSGGTVAFRHAGGTLTPTPSARRTTFGAGGDGTGAVDANVALAAGVARITMLSFGLDSGKAVTLLLGDPKKVARFSYSRDGAAFASLPSHAGAAILTRRPLMLSGLVLDMVRAFDSAGHTLTPADSHAVRVADIAPEVDRVPDAWSLPDYAAQ